MGVLPNSQFGDVAVIDLGNSTSSVLVSDSSGNARSVNIATALTSSANSSSVSVNLPSGKTVSKDSRLYVSLRDMSSQMTVLALRWFLLFLIMILSIGNPIQCLTLNIVTGTKVC